VRVDFNCDVGESFGRYQLGHDAEVMKLVTSVSIACGFHAGDPGVMRRTVELAHENGIAIGAHPGYQDLQGFGRRSIVMSGEEIHDLVLYQVGALDGFMRRTGGRLQHVKPHGALYNDAARSAEAAHAIVAATAELDRDLIVVGLPGSEMERAAAGLGVSFAAEVFADRTYRPDGSLTPRRDPAAFVSDPEVAARRALSMLREGTVETTSGASIPIRADTICLHGDNPAALVFARRIVRALKDAGVALLPLGAR
jgi:UPF0271 protein